jgi:hypothetical protein
VIFFKHRRNRMHQTKIKKLNMFKCSGEEREAPNVFQGTQQSRCLLSLRRKEIPFRKRYVLQSFRIPDDG